MFTPTLILPPQGGGGKKRVNFPSKGEEIRGVNYRFEGGGDKRS